MRWDPERYAVHAGFVPELGEIVLEMLAPAPGERILDLGCGDGVLTERIAAAGAEVVAVDRSPDMVATTAVRGFDARVVDGEALPFDAEFDAVFSNAALHWMTRQDAVVAGVARALRPGGRFVAELGGHGCVAAITTALVATLARRGVDGNARRPWYFPTAEEHAELLEGHGFVVDDIALVPRLTRLPGELTDWLETFAPPFLDGLDGTARAAVLAETAELLRPALWSARTGWTADYVRLRFAAHLA